MMKKSLIISELSKSYNKRMILDQVSLEVNEGERVGILGSNGSGKSTLMSIVAGMASADSGEVLYEGAPLTKKQRRSIGYVPQVPNLFEDLTVADNIQLWKSVYGIHKKVNVYDEIPEFLHIEEIKKEKVSHISQGLRKKVSIAIAFMNRPKLLILDEVFAALDGETSRGLKEYLQQNTELSYLYTSHIATEVEELCNSYYMIDQGIMRKINSSKEYMK